MTVVDSVVEMVVTSQVIPKALSEFPAVSLMNLRSSHESESCFEIQPKLAGNVR